LQVVSRILHMEEYRDLRKLVSFILSSQGLEVTGVGDGESGIEELANSDFDAIVLTQETPLKTGHAVLEWIAANRPHLLPRVLFTIGSPSTPALDRELAKLQIPVFAKPFSVHALAERIKSVAADKNGHFAA
jgi:CheY-like chemotaxis protein